MTEEEKKQISMMLAIVAATCGFIGCICSILLATRDLWMG